MMGSERPTREVRWPLLRVEPGHDHELVLLDAQWLKVDVHYWKRTQICLGSDDCPVCSFLPSRAYYYLPAVWRGNRRPCLLELSPLAAADLEQVAKLLGRGVRAGVAVKVSRRSCKAPLRFEWLEDGAKVGHVELHEWVSAVMAVYGFKAMAPGESLEGYRERLRVAALTRCQRLAHELGGMTSRSRK